MKEKKQPLSKEKLDDSSMADVSLEIDEEILESKSSEEGESGFDKGRRRKEDHQRKRRNTNTSTRQKGPEKQVSRIG